MKLEDIPIVQPTGKPLLTDEQKEKMIANYRIAQDDDAFDPLPVVKLFTTSGCTWLLSQLDPKEEWRAYGVCDLNLGCVEWGSVDLRELCNPVLKVSQRAENDRLFVPEKTEGQYLRGKWL